MKNFNKGFTLIELLIVIALLGALAVGLLAALDPFEQLKKGTDTGIRNTAAELHGAMIRYYGIKNFMPWCTNGDCTAWNDDLLSGDLPAAGVLGTALTETIVAIEGTGELKAGFSGIAGAGAMGKITVFGSNSPNPTAQVCYKPTAKSFINDPNTKYVVGTGLENVEVGAARCKGQGGDVLTCLWCIE